VAGNPFGAITLPTQLFLSFALGHAASPAIEPFAASIENEAWAAHTVKPPTIYTFAPMDARGKLVGYPVNDWAHFQGFSDNVLAALKDGSLVGPDLADLFEMWRRGEIGQTEFETGMTTLGVQPAWFGHLESLKRVHLSPAEAANARQQQFITQGEQEAIAALYGITTDDADIQFELAGLPPGVETGLQMWRRGIIGKAEFDQIVAEGHTKTKYTADLEALKNQVLSASTYVRAHLKGHATQQEMYDGGALTGYRPADLDLMYLSEGRPATAHQIHIGYARGAELGAGISEQEAIATSVKQSDIRPEYTDLIYAGRDTYPSLFQITRLVTGGTISADTGATWAHKAGLAAEVVTALHASWAGTGGATAADTHVAKAQTQLWTTTHRGYLTSKITDQEATAALTKAGVASGSIPAVLSTWQAERDLDRKTLSAAQVKKAWVENVENPDTGAAWTRDEALAYLIELGYSPSDAATFLEL